MDYYVVERPNGVGVIALTPEDNVVLVRQYRHPHKKWMIQIPAGNVESGETPLKTIKRELLEETGYAAQKFIPLSKIHLAASIMTSIMHLYIAENAERIQSPAHDKSEDIEVLEVELDEAVRMVREGMIGDVDSALTILIAYDHIKLQSRVPYELRKRGEQLFRFATKIQNRIIEKIGEMLHAIEIYKYNRAMKQHQFSSKTI